MRRSSLFVLLALGACAPTPGVAIEGAAMTDSMCLWGPTSPRIVHGQYDVYTRVAYTADVVYRNRGDDFTVTGAIVALENPDGTPLATPFFTTYRVAASAFIPAGTETSPTEAAGSIQIIPVAVDDVLPALVPHGTPLELVVRVKAYGTNSTGSRVYMDDWTYPITVCNQCLCTTPPATSCHPGADGEGYAGIHVCH